MRSRRCGIYITASTAATHAEDSGAWMEISMAGQERDSRPNKRLRGCIISETQLPLKLNACCRIAVAGPTATNEF